MRWLLATIAACAALVILAAPHGGHAQGQPPLVSPGGRYIVTFDCWPEWAALFASQYAGGAALNPCYADDVTVKRVRSDGWVEIELQGRPWLINLDSITGITANPQTQAQR